MVDLKSAVVLFGVNPDSPRSRVSWSVVCAVDLRQRGILYRPVRTGCVAFADGSLMMIMLSPGLEDWTQRHALGERPGP
jgi:hypothetical protein